MTGLRHLFALRDAVLERNESLKTGRSLDLWMQVLNERSAGGPVDAAAARILNSFLVTQSQSAACERTFATVEELKILGLTLTFSVRMLPNPFRTLSFCGVVIPDLLQIEKNFSPLEKFFFRKRFCSVPWGNTSAREPLQPCWNSIWSSRQDLCPEIVVLWSASACRSGSERRGACQCPLLSGRAAELCSKGAGPNAVMWAANAQITKERFVGWRLQNL